MKYVCVFFFIGLILTSSAQSKLRFAHQIDAMGSFDITLFPDHHELYPKYYDARLGYLPTLQFDSSFALSVALGSELSVRNRRDVLSYNRYLSIFYGFRGSYNFRPCKKSPPIQIGLEAHLFNESLYIEDNGSLSQHKLNGYGGIFHIGPVLKVSHMDVVPKINVIYRKRDRFYFSRLEQELFVRMGIQLTF